jgi:hypothetical protein
MAQDAKTLIEGEVLDTLYLSNQLSIMENELMENPMFVKFLEMQKIVNDKVAETWKLVETQMIEHDIKKIEGDWGSLTIAERMDFDVDEKELAPRFKKTVADTTKIRTIYQLDRKPIAGAIPKYKKYLVKRIKLGGKDD